MSDTLSDEILYSRYIGGEESAANVLVERYGDALTIYIDGYLRDIHEAEDLMIEAFARIFAKERPIRRDGSFRAYLYKTARNLAFRHLGRHRLSLLHLDELEFDPPDEVLTETEFIRDERHRTLYAAMEQLKAEYREALFLVYFEDLSYREAAEVMGKNENQVTKLVYHGKQRLKALLEQGGFTYGDE